MDKLPANEREVEIHLLAASSDSEQLSSIDHYIYSVAERKDRLIKDMEHLLKGIAIDCPMHQQRNTPNSIFNNTRDCEYDRCEYKCDVPTPDANHYILDTYSAYYADRSRITSCISDLFKFIQIESINMGTISTIVNRLVYTGTLPIRKQFVYMIAQVITDMINSGYIIDNVYRGKCILGYDDSSNYIFLASPHKCPSNSILDAYYGSHKFVHDQAPEISIDLPDQSNIQEILKGLNHPSVAYPGSDLLKVPRDLLQALIERHVVRGMDTPISNTLRAVLIESAYLVPAGDYIVSTIGTKANHLAFDTNQKEWFNIASRSVDRATVTKPLLIALNESLMNHTTRMVELLTRRIMDARNISLAEAEKVARTSYLGTYTRTPTKDLVFSLVSVESTIVYLKKTRNSLNKGMKKTNDFAEHQQTLMPPKGQNCLTTSSKMKKTELIQTYVNVVGQQPAAGITVNAICADLEGAYRRAKLILYCGYGGAV